MFSFITNNYKNINTKIYSPNPIMEDELNNVEFEHTKPFIPPIEKGKVVKVYDGDTITIAVKLYNDIYRFSVRLNGIDTPEMKSKNENVKLRAQRAKTAMHNLVMGKIVYLKNVDYDKYGRILADIYVGNIHVNQYMIDNGHAIHYNGGHKADHEIWFSSNDL